MQKSAIPSLSPRAYPAKCRHRFVGQHGHTVTNGEDEKMLTGEGQSTFTPSKSYKPVKSNAMSKVVKFRITRSIAHCLRGHVEKIPDSVRGHNLNNDFAKYIWLGIFRLNCCSEKTPGCQEHTETAPVASVPHDAGPTQPRKTLTQLTTSTANMKERELLLQHECCTASEKESRYTSPYRATGRCTPSLISRAPVAHTLTV